MTQHILGHQDKKPKEDLTLAKQLNVECNNHASKMLPMLQEHSIFLPYPQLSAAQPYLIIHDKTIVYEIADALQLAAVTPDYKEYLQEKLEGTDNNSHKVNCNAIKLTTKHVKPQEQQTLHKYLHDWQPLGATKHRGLLPLKQTLCPSCQ